MKVHVYDYVAQHEVLRGTTDLAEVLPNPLRRAHAELYLRKVGRYWMEGETTLMLLVSVAK